MRTLRVDIEGIDLVLGGGFRLLERVPGAGESATILIRGPAGSGKTVLGTQFAASIARALDTDVAYGCVELLPAELRAQHEGIRGESAKEKVIFLSENDAPEQGFGMVRIYAGLLDLGEEGTAAERLGEAVATLLDAANSRANRKVRVLVIDSLSEGYGIGADAPRVLADGVSKFAAEQGLVVILLEEQAREGSSVWGFAVDTVFELKPAEEGTPFERRLLVSKNRLGPSDPGPHEFSVWSQSGVVVYPRVVAYLKPWRSDVLRHRRVEKDIAYPWRPDGLSAVSELPPFRTASIAVIGTDPALVSQLALVIRDDRPSSMSGKLGNMGPEISIVLGRASAPGLEGSSVEEDVVELAFGSLQSGSLVLAALRREIERQSAEGDAPYRVVIGDLRAAVLHADPEEGSRTVSVIMSLARSMKIPLVLYDTSREFQSVSTLVASADVVVECVGAQQWDERRKSSVVPVRVDVRMGTYMKSDRVYVYF